MPFVIKITVCSNYDPGLTLTYFTPKSSMVAKALVQEKVKIIFKEIIAAYELKIRKCIKLNESVKLHQYQRSRLFFEYCKMRLGFQTLFLYFIFLKNCWVISN